MPLLLIDEITDVSFDPPPTQQQDPRKLQSWVQSTAARAAVNVVMGNRVARDDYEWVYTEQPHADRRKEILGELACPRSFVSFSIAANINEKHSCRTFPPSFSCATMEIWQLSLLLFYRVSN